MYSVASQAGPVTRRYPLASIIAVLSIIWTSTHAPKFMWELKLLFCFHTGTFIEASFEASADTAQIQSSLDTDIQLFFNFMTKAAQFPMTTNSTQGTQAAAASSS